MGICDINGKTIVTDGSTATSDFGVTDYAVFTDAYGDSARQAVLTYQGKRLYPKNYPEQRLDFV